MLPAVLGDDEPGLGLLEPRDGRDMLLPALADGADRCWVGSGRDGWAMLRLAEPVGDALRGLDIDGC